MGTSKILHHYLLTIPLTYLQLTHQTRQMITPDKSLSSSPSQCIVPTHPPLSTPPHHLPLYLPTYSKHLTTFITSLFNLLRRSLKINSPVMNKITCRKRKWDEEGVTHGCVLYLTHCDTWPSNQPTHTPTSSLTQAVIFFILHSLSLSHSKA